MNVISSSEDLARERTQRAGRRAGKDTARGHVEQPLLPCQGSIPEATRAFMEAVPDGVLLCTRTGSVLWANGDAARLLGVGQSELREKSLLDLLRRARGRPQTQGLLSLVATDGKPRELALRLATEGSDQRYLELRAARLVSEGGEGHVCIFLREFTDQEKQRVQTRIYAAELGALYRESRNFSKQVESLYTVAKSLNAKLELSEMLKGILELLGPLVSPKLTLGLAVRDGAGRSFKVMSSHGPKADELQEATIPRTGRGAIPSEVLKDLRPTVFGSRVPPPEALRVIGDKCGATSIGVLPLITKNKTVGLLLYCSPKGLAFADLDQAFYQGICELLAAGIERAGLYAAKKRQLAQARNLDETRQNLLSAISHDFRTPITALKTSVELLSDPEAIKWGSSNHVRLMASISRSIKRLDNLITDLNEASRLQSGNLSLNLRATSLDESIRRVVSLMPPERAQRIKVNSPVAGISVTGDPVRLDQLVSNILDNAVKYSPDGSDIDVELTTSDTEARLTICDRGPGVPKDERNKIFKPFYRLERDMALAGTGLGLAIVKWLTELHGGRIWVESRQGGGSRFCISLPVGGVQ